jgi:hypothetical protein
MGSATACAIGRSDAGHGVYSGIRLSRPAARRVTNLERPDHPVRVDVDPESHGIVSTTRRPDLCTDRRVVERASPTRRLRDDRSDDPRDAAHDSDGGTAPGTRAATSYVDAAAGLQVEVAQDAVLGRGEDRVVALVGRSGEQEATVSHARHKVAQVAPRFAALGLPDGQEARLPWLFEPPASATTSIS